MKMIKKVVAMVIAVTMIISSMTAFAATTDIIDANEKASLTIRKYDQTAAEAGGVDINNFTATGEADSEAEEVLSNYALSGVEFTYVKVGDIITDSNAGSIQMLYNLPTAVEEVLGLTAENHKYTSDQINTAMATALTNNTTTKNKLEDFAIKEGTHMDPTGTDGSTTKTDLELGLYLVVETEVPEDVQYTTNPFFVSLPMTDSAGDYWNYDVVVYPKNQTNLPDINKRVTENGTYADIATASEGDVLDYLVVSKLPTITSKASYLTKYSFVDTLSAALKYNKDTAIAFFDTKYDAENLSLDKAIAKWDAGSENFTVEYDDDANTMTVAMTAAGLAAMNPAMSDKYIVIYYKTTMQSGADVVLGDTGNSNDVTLTLSRTNIEEEQTIADKSIVYSYGLNIQKNFSDNAGDATKVSFKLKNDTDNYFVKATGSNGVYYVTGQGTEEADGTSFVPAADGTLKINGLEADTYIMTETHTDAGYSLLRQPTTIVITSTIKNITPSKATVTGITNTNPEVVVTDVSIASATVDAIGTNMSNDNASTNAKVDMSILNRKTFTLPQTGGMGTILFTLGGALIIAFGIILLLKKKKTL